jgi:hypothetical protein
MIKISYYYLFIYRFHRNVATFQNKYKYHGDINFLSFYFTHRDEISLDSFILKIYPFLKSVSHGFQISSEIKKLSKLESN